MAAKYLEHLCVLIQNDIEVNGQKESFIPEKSHYTLHGPSQLNGHLDISGQN